MTRYTRAGKEILMDGRHMAYAAGEGIALIIVEALQASETAPPLPPCAAYRVNDQMMCECGRQWDVSDPVPPRCPVAS